MNGGWTSAYGQRQDADRPCAHDAGEPDRWNRLGTPTSLALAAGASLLLWNARDPDGAKVTGYKIERSINGGEYSIRVENMPANKTFWVDRTELTVPTPTRIA